MLIEVARQLAARPQKLPRRVLFLAFTGEELGLLGSARYMSASRSIRWIKTDCHAEHGHGRPAAAERKLIVHGTGTAPEFPIRWRNAFSKEFRLSAHQSSPAGFGP